MAKRVLVADDEPNIVISLEFLLTRAGFEVEVTTNGEETLQAVARKPPDLLLLDVMLPLKNGFEVCQAVRADPALAGMKVMMLTAKGRDTEITKGFALGADAYVTKPFGTRELVEKIRALVGQ